MTQIAVFPGTFDPITFGHQELIMRAVQLFTQVIVAVASNNLKKPLFSLEQRTSMVHGSIKGSKNIQVIGFSNLLVEFMREHNATVIVRGVRVAADFDYEMQLASMNRDLNKNIETVLLTPAAQYSYLSSTLVKEVAQLGGDVSSFVNAEVVAALKSVKWH